MRPGKLIRITLRAPEKIGTSDKQMRRATCIFFGQLRDLITRQGIRIVLDFSQTEALYPAGAAMLLAETDRALALMPNPDNVQVIRPAHQLTDEILQQIEFYKRVGMSSRHAPSHENVVHWRAASGVLSDGTTGGSILDKYDGRLADRISKGLYAGIVEAMTNTVHHAYRGVLGAQLRSGIGRRWWMLSEERDGILTVVIFDLGIGIPRSLPRSETFEWKIVRTMWKKLGLDSSDGSAIQVALSLGNTRTKQPGRGNGLADIISAGSLSKGGGVLISSNKGIVTFNKGKLEVYNHPQSLRGTLIHWFVPVAEEAR